MDNLRLSAVADRVVAWHNRHPLARRISAAQVHAIGYVALPFAAEGPAPMPPVASEAPSAPETPSPAQLAAQAIAAAAAMPLPVLTDVAMAASADTANPANLANPAEGSRLRERALARAREQAADLHGVHGVHGAQAADTAAALQATLAPATLKRDFSEHFIDTLTPRQVARFALKQGRVLARAPLDGPVREVRADSAHRGRVPAQVYLLTAVIETDTRKSRVLLGNGPQVLGRRIHSGPRIAALAALGACVVGTPLWLLQPPASMPTLKSAPESMTAPGTDARLAMGGAAAAAAAASATLPAVVASASAAASSSTPMAQGPAPVIPMIEPAPSAPVEPEATTRRRVVAIVPLLSDEQKALAREQRQALMAAAAVAAAAAPAAPSPAPAPVVSATAPTVPVFAISTRTLRTRSEADQVQVAMQSLLLTLGQEQVQVDVLPQGEDWRVVALPFPRRADAEKGRALLASRGMRVVVVDF